MPIDLSASNAIKKTATNSIESIATVARQLEMKESDKDLRTQSRQLMEDSFRIMVAGRFKNGKSTLLNALLGKPSVPVPGMLDDQGPMPVRDLPATAVLTSVSYAEKAFVRKWTFDGKSEDWTMERYLREARVKPDQEETEKFFANIREFQMGFPAEICRQGVTIIDSPGTDDVPQRTTITQDAARTCDAAIVVFRSDVLAGGSEREFVDNVLAIDGTHNFVVVNLMHGKKIDDEFLQFAWNRLVKLMRGGPRYMGQDFASQDIYFVDAKMAEQGKFTGDAAMVTASGLDLLERNLGQYLTTERHRQHIEKFVKGAIRLTQPVEDQIRRRSAALHAEQETLEKGYAEVLQQLERIDEPKKKIPAIFEKYKGRAQREVTASLEREIIHLERELPALLDAYPLPSAGWTSLIRQKRMMQEAADFCQRTIAERLSQWSSSTNGGAKKALDPVIEELLEDVQHEIQQTEKAYRSFYLKVLGPELSEANQDPMSWYERAGWVAAGLFFHDVGLAVGGGALGWRGAVATIGSYVAAGLASVALGLSFAVALPLAIITALAAQIFTGKQYLEGAIKKKVLQEVLSGNPGAEPPRPPLSSLSKTAAPAIEASLSEQLANMEQALMTSISTIIAEEQRNLKAIVENSQRSAAEKEQRLAELAALANQTAESKKRLEGILAEAKQVLA